MRWLLFLFSFSAHASTVLIQGPQTSGTDYKAMLKAYSEYVSPEDHYLRSHPARSQRERLLTAFSEAQKAFLEKSDLEARSKFQEVLSLLPADDWERSDREIFLNAYFRLAQLEADSGARDRWLSSSLHLGDAGWDASLFPPPLISRREELRKQTPKMNIAKSLFARGWTEVLVNGLRCERKACTDWPAAPGYVRVTVLSSQWLSQTAVIKAVEAEGYSPPTVAFAQGACRNEIAHEKTLSFSHRKIFWGMDCEQAPNTALNLNPVPAKAADFPPPPAKASKSLFESKWFWAAVGTAVAVAIVAGQKKNEAAKESTASYGY